MLKYILISILFLILPWWLKILCVACFVGLVIYRIKHNNPYRLVYIFGKKGSGKSLTMVKWIIKDLKRGWTVYTNMTDVYVPGVRLFKVSDLDKFTPPPNSSIYIDEGGIAYDNRKMNLSDGTRDWYKFQRKYRCKVVINSQSYDVDKKIRDLVDEMYLQESFFDLIFYSKRIKKAPDIKEASSTAESKIVDNLEFMPFWTWKYTLGPRWFKFFNTLEAPDRLEIPFKEVKNDD